MDLDKLYSTMVSLRESAKLEHFNTRSYARHKATDMFVEEFDDLFDEFWESYVADNKIKLRLTGIKVGTVDSLIDTLSQMLLEISDRKVAATIDDLFELFAKFRYLSQFK